MGSLEQYYEFSPSDQRLIHAYLHPKIAGKDVGGDYIHDADVTSDHPYDLVRKHAPARGSVTGGGGGKGVWFFFSPVRYVGNSKASARSGSRLRNRAPTISGADGKKKGTWHTEGRKTMVRGSRGGYFQKLSYDEVTPSGSVTKPGWLMVEYAIEEEHGGGAMVLCKVYKSPRAPGSDVSSSSRKRKACVVEQMQLPCKRTNKDGNLLREDLTATNSYAAAPAHQDTERMFLAAGNLLHNDLTVTSAIVHYAAALAYQETEHVLGFGKRRVCGVGGGPMRTEDRSGGQPVPPCASLTEDEDDVMEIFMIVD